MGNFFNPRAVLKTFWALQAILSKEQEQKFTFSHELHPAWVEKATPRARQKALVGRIWPADRTLPTPGIDECHLWTNPKTNLTRRCFPVRWERRRWLWSRHRRGQSRTYPPGRSSLTTARSPAIKFIFMLTIPKSWCVLQTQTFCLYESNDIAFWTKHLWTSSILSGIVKESSFVKNARTSSSCSKLPKHEIQ